MFVGTHSFVPILAASAVNAYRVNFGRKSLFTVKELAFIGLAGTLPDLLSPHISLGARLSSWTHNFWFLLFSAPFLFAFAWLISRQKTFLLGGFFWLALALHLLIDISSGGISPFYPLGPVIGFRIVPFHYWIFVDALVILSSLLLAYWVRRVKTAAQVKESMIRRIDPPCQQQ